MKLVSKALTFTYPFAKEPTLNELSFTAEQGSYWCIAGPNGSGKSTFLKLACGLVADAQYKGELTWDDRPLVAWDRLELAKNVAFVPGSLRTQFPVSVSEFVLQGRYARSPNFWAHPSADDRELAQACLERIGIAAKAESIIGEISAGETQLALIARALAQQPQVLVLDESTANLDLSFQLSIFELLRELNNEGLTILVVSHDLNLAAEFCPNILWLSKGAVFAQGPTEETLTTSLMRELYCVEGRAEVGKNPFTSRPKIFWK